MLEIKITSGSGYFNRNCALCGASLETHPAQPRAYENEAKIGLVCEPCIAARPDGIATRMRDHASWLENTAAELRRLAAGEISSPTTDDVRNAMAAVDAAVGAEAVEAGWEPATCEPLTDDSLPF